MTMSISRAPYSTASLISASLVSRGVCPAGNPAATSMKGVQVEGKMFHECVKVLEIDHKIENTNNTQKSLNVNSFFFNACHDFKNLQALHPTLSSPIRNIGSTLKNPCPAR